MANELTREEHSEDWVYKGSPFLNIGPQVQKEYYEKPIDPNYNGPHPSHQIQIHPYLLSKKSPFKVKDGSIWYKDVIFITNEGYQIIIRDYISKHQVIVEFLHSGVRVTARMKDIKCGCVKYPYHPNRYGFFLGEGLYKMDGPMKKYVNLWGAMQERTQDPVLQQRTRNWQYVGVKIDYEWYNYQNFVNWIDEYFKSLNPNLYNDYQIDKDILQWGIEPKVYGPKTCCLVPSLINITLSAKSTNDNGLPIGVYKKETKNGISYFSSINKYGENNHINKCNSAEEAFQAYKKAKESYIRELADYYYSINALHKEIRDRLYMISIQPDGSEKLYIN